MIWFNIVLTAVIVFFSIGIVGETERDRLKLFHSVLLLSIVVFGVLNFVNLYY